MDAALVLDAVTALDDAILQLSKTAASREHGRKIWPEDARAVVSAAAVVGGFTQSLAVHTMCSLSCDEREHTDIHATLIKAATPGAVDGDTAHLMRARAVRALHNLQCEEANRCEWAHAGTRAALLDDDAAEVETENFADDCEAWEHEDAATGCEGAPSPH